MARSSSINKINPRDVDREIAARAARRVKDYLSRHPEDPDSDTIEILVEGGAEEALVIPRAAVTMFAQILSQMAEGHGVAVIPSHTELSTQEAADMLNVSRPYLIGLLESGKIPHRKVGRHRRVRFEDLLEYKRHDDSQRRAAADELTDLSQELGLY